MIARTVVKGTINMIEMIGTKKGTADGIILPTATIAGAKPSTRLSRLPGMSTAIDFIARDTQLSASMIIDGAIDFQDCMPTDGKIFTVTGSGIKDVT
ncbi:hypothetical protein AXX12_00610 [Anaerosporomusa subterranea]|uniref:Uncharacterized protein n=1 Tax=Anaerosporomusa subterranea TaxID=1794912 RepID=A0A154BVV8_ANASB|nr:hypothetical protein AXX12_00610 [Anaerosporomusa subterranea]